MLLTILQSAAIVLATLPLSIGATIAGQWRRTHFIFFGIGRIWAKILLRIAGISLTVRGAGNIDPAKSYVLAANHASLFDIPTILASVPGNVCFVMKRELTRVPIWGWGLIRSPYIVINRSSLRDARRGMEQTASRLREGSRSVAFFPEGTRTRDGKLQPFKRGAFSAAISAGTPVVPITINGSFNILPKGKFKINRGKIEVVIGVPVSAADESSLMTLVSDEIARHYRAQ